MTQYKFYKDKFTDNNNNQENVKLFEKLLGMTSWNDFAKSLVEQINTKGFLSDKQKFSANAMFIKMEQNKKHKQEQKCKSEHLADKFNDTAPLSRIHKMFDDAVGNNLKRPIVKFDDLILSLAKPESANAGAVYVVIKKGGYNYYQGKIVENIFYHSSTADENTINRLYEIAKDPFKTAKEYGQRLGRCCMCSRTLTNKVSIDLGMGPICRDNWGL